MSKEYLKTTIGLEIHVQLATKSKMFCRCDNNAEGKEPNTTICPICLGMPGTLPVTNKQAVLWTIKTGITLNCTINKISKFDRKHYFYPDLPKGYQISQYDEPFCSGGYLEINGHKIKLNRIHLEEDAGKLIHKDGKSLVDLNRAGTPLMEIVTEPDIDSPAEAADFLRRLQKIVRDEVSVSEASMEKGHMRCDANISISDDKGHMSEIVELKNINSFKFVEKALLIEEVRLREKYPDWPEKVSKETRGYDSKKNETYTQRRKEVAADYRYFPEPDLPPFDTSELDLESLASGVNESEEIIISKLQEMGIPSFESQALAKDQIKRQIFEELSKSNKNYPFIAKAIVHNLFGFKFCQSDSLKTDSYNQALIEFDNGKLSKPIFADIVKLIHEKEYSFEQAMKETGGQIGNEDELASIIENVIKSNPKELENYKNGKKQLLGFFIGQVMKESKGKANPVSVNKILKDKLEQE